VRKLWAATRRLPRIRCSSVSSCGGPTVPPQLMCYATECDSNDVRFGRATPFSTLTICATLLGTHRAAPAAIWAQSSVSIVPLPSSFLVVDRPTLHVCLRSGFGARGFALHVLLGHLGAHSFLGRYAARKSDADVQPYRDFDPVAVSKARNPASARPLALFAPKSNFAALVFTISADVRTRRNYSVIGRR
jgi:hypothetical protein